jgi:hypothetical protein
MYFCQPRIVIKRPRSSWCPCNAFNGTNGLLIIVCVIVVVIIVKIAVLIVCALKSPIIDYDGFVFLQELADGLKVIIKPISVISMVSIDPESSLDSLGDGFNGSKKVKLRSPVG